MESPWLQAVPLAALVCAATIGCLLLLLRLVASGGASLAARGRPAAVGRLTDYRDWPPHLQGTPAHMARLPMYPSSPHHLALSTSEGLVETMAMEACSKAREAGRHPSYGQLCLTLVHHYSLDINSPAAAGGLTIFHCACLSGRRELVSALLPLALMEVLTEHGESALHLAVSAACTSPGRPDHGVVEVLLGAGAEVNLPTWEGVTPLQLASRRGDLALARLLLHWGASTGTSSLPITSLNLTPTMTYSELEEEKKEKLVAKQKEEEMKSLQEKEVSNKKGDKVVKEKELKSEVNVNKEKEVTKKRGGRVNKGREATRRKEEMIAEEKLEEEEKEERDTAVQDRMVMRAGCEVCGERGATLREVEGLLVCLPCTKQQQTSYSTVSSTPSSSGDSTTKPTRRAKKPTEN